MRDWRQRMVPARAGPAQSRAGQAGSQTVSSRSANRCSTANCGNCGRIAAGGAVSSEHGTDPRPWNMPRAWPWWSRARPGGIRDYREDIAQPSRFMDQSAISSVPCSFSSSELVLQPQARYSERLLRVGRTVVASWYRDSGDAVAPPEVILLADRLGVLPSSALADHAFRADDQRSSPPGHGVAPVPESDRADMRDEELPDLISQGLRTWRVNPRNLRSRLPRLHCSPTRCGCVR